eukprot:14244.XXX_706105_706233_1 [CDS] Oithona nana genome sequencing.
MHMAPKQSKMPVSSVKSYESLFFLGLNYRWPDYYPDSKLLES